jgi:hypothetical protein
LNINLIDPRKYRNDIDGLRAIAVLVAIFSHFGYLSNCYLGVDVFFVISVYFITGIIYNKIFKKKQCGSDNYFDLIETLIDENIKMPVFTLDCKFISHDSRHLTQSGAKYVASIIKNQLTFLDFAND